MKKLITLFQFLCVSFVFVAAYAQPVCEPALLTRVERLGAGNLIAWAMPLTGEEVTISQSGNYTQWPLGDGRFSFGAYHRFTLEDLSAIDGAVLTQMVFAPTYSFSQTEPSHSYTLQVYKGGVWGVFGERNPGTLVSSQELNNDNLLFFEENTITLETPVEIDGTQELWIGFYCRAFDTIQSKLKYPMGRDDGPRKEGFGNIGRLDNQWYTFYEFSYLNDFNPYIKGIVQTAEGESVNIYFNGDKIESNIEGITYFHENPTGEEHCYQVEVNCLDGGISLKSNEICIPGVGINENREDARFILYPNPASETVNIQSNTIINSIQIINIMGQEVFSSYVNGKKLDINTSNFNVGLYFVKIQTATGFQNAKLIIE